MFATGAVINRSKCYVTHGVLPLDIRTDCPSKTKKPFSTILASPWYHTVDLILPTEILALVNDAIEREKHYLHYSRVHMKLEELIDGDFFNRYIKTGAIEMLSEGFPVLDTQYSLREGVLRIDLSKDKFQRLGLDGRPIPSGGRKHVPTRMRIELNLRLPSMVTGRKGFERVRWAFKNVLNESVTWLFRECSKVKSDLIVEGSGTLPIDSFHPLARSAHPPVKTIMPGTRIPDLVAPTRISDQSSSQIRSEYTYDLLEWLSLVALSSPRVNASDNIDPYLCRYRCQPEMSDTASMTILRWHGFLPAMWLSRITALCASLLQTKNQAWFAINAKVMRLEEGNDLTDGWSLLYPALRGPDASDQIDETDANESMADIDASGSVQWISSSNKLTTLIREPRDFVLWEMVDSTTQR